MTESQLAKWKKRRANGALRFIIKFAVVWAVGYTTLFYLAEIVVPRISDIKPTGVLFTLEGFAIFTGMAIIAGTFVSGLVWLVNETSYIRHTSDQRRSTNNEPTK